MALALNYTTESGINIPSAYCRIDQIFVTKKNTMQLSVNFYADEAHVVPFHGEKYKTDYDFTQSNPLNQGYDYLKTLPEFSVATDC